MAGIERALDIDLHGGDASDAAIDAFIAPQMRHHVADARLPVDPLVEPLQEAMGHDSRDVPPPGWPAAVGRFEARLAPAEGVVGGLAGTLAAAPDRIVYVSCDVATLARDAGKLTEAGYRLDSLEAFDLFPNTAHIESLAVFGRVA